MKHTKGEIAKAKVIETIKNAFGENFYGIKDKKLYVAANENGESIQFYLAITQPKNGLSRNDFTMQWGEATTSAPADANIAPIDAEKLTELKKKLGME